MFYNHEWKVDFTQGNVLHPKSDQAKQKHEPEGKKVAMQWINKISPAIGKEEIVLQTQPAAHVQNVIESSYL